MEAITTLILVPFLPILFPAIGQYLDWLMGVAFLPLLVITEHSDLAFLLPERLYQNSSFNGR